MISDTSEVDTNQVELTVIMVSYNTRELTLKALETLYENTHVARFETVVLDNASSDGSADAIEAAFPQVTLIRSPDNLGFAKANNVVAQAATTPWLLLLNPDTETRPHAIDNLLVFSKANPQAGITGGRTVFPDGRLNAFSCGMLLSPWSLFAITVGLKGLFPQNPVLNPEGMGGWERDSVREVDFIVGCFLMIPRKLWNELGGFDLKFFMYGEEVDMCMRAKAMGYQPMMTPDATIMHLVGAASGVRAEKQIMVAKSRVTLLRDHWPAWQVPVGLVLMWIWGAMRVTAASVLGVLKPARFGEKAVHWRLVWSRRGEWLRGY